MHGTPGSSCQFLPRNVFLDTQKEVSQSNRKSLVTFGLDSIMALDKLMHIYSIFLLLLCFGVASSWKHQIKVSSRSGNDTNLCLSNFSTPCKTLAYVLENELNNSTFVEIENGTYFLDKVYSIKHIQNISIVGEGKVDIKCNSSANESGISWLFSEGIVLRHLSFDSCSYVVQAPPLDNNSSVYQFYAGIGFTYCIDVDLNFCTFSNSCGVAVVMYDTGGTVNVINSTFMHNGVWNSPVGFDSNVHNSSGGILIHLTQNGSLYPFIKDDTTHLRYSSNNTYNFKNSKFIANRYKFELLPDVDTPSFFGWGGGLTVLVCGSAQNNTFAIDSCHFEENEAIWGGGMFAEFHNKAQGNSMKVFNNTFQRNKAKFGGGAMRTGNNIIEDVQTAPHLKENKIEHTWNVFDDNVAVLGGALSHYGWTYNQETMTDFRRICFKECIFKNNKATMGSAIFVALNNKNNWRGMGNEMPYTIELENCSVHDNIAIKDNVTGMGAVYTSEVPFILRGNNMFKNNTNTAFLLDNAPLKVIGNVHFMGNKGFMGGALAFYGQSKLVLTKHSYVLFAYNEAKQKGGAWYIRAPGPEVTPFHTTKLQRHPCFVIYDDDGHLINLYYLDKWQTKLEFLNNTAPPFCGNSVYATTLQSCYRLGEGSGDNTAFEWKQIIIYNIAGKVEDEISTDPVAIHFKRHEWSHLAPYEQFNASIRLLDEKDSTVSGVVKITVSSSDKSLSLVPKSSLFLVQTSKHGNSTKSVVPGLRIRGAKGQRFNLEISTTNGQVVRNTSRNLKLNSCRDGFEQIEKFPDKCVCMDETETHHEGISRCSEDSKNVYLKMGYWGGRVPNGKGEHDFITYPCPNGYCFFDPNSTDFMYNKSTICASNRAGDAILCGKCKKKYSLSLGNENCTADVECDNHVYSIYWGLPTFLIIVPFVVFGLLYINVDIFTSYLNAWLYFYQILPFVVQTQEQFDNGMQWILALVAWKIEGAHLTCFMKGLDNITKLVFNYLFPLYVLFVVIIISQITRCYTRCTGRICFERTNVFRAISTILVLCYTNLILISLNVCFWVRIDSNIDVLLVQGSIYSTRSGINDPSIPPLYYVLLVVAILVIVFIVIALPLALLLRSCLVRKFAFMQNFRSLYDIFDHCFRDGCGRFSAYYFIWRIIFLLLTSLLSTPGPYRRCWFELLTVLSLVIFVYFQPYRTDSNLRWLNLIDTGILTDLCLMAIMSSSRNSEASKSTKHGLEIAIQVLSWLPMVYLLVLIVLAIRHYCGGYFNFPCKLGYQNIDGEEHSDGNSSGPSTA